MRKLNFNLSKLPGADRIIGFTIPKSEEFYVCDHDEVWKVAIAATPNIEVTEHLPYKFVENRGDFLGLVLKGLTANEPVMGVGQSEIAYQFNPKKEFVTVKYKVAGRSGQIEFPTLSGDWFAASFSADGRYLVLGEPYDLAVYEVA